MDLTAPPNPAGLPSPEDSITGDLETESARSRSVPGAELPIVTTREGQVALTEQALRSHAGSLGYPSASVIPSRTPLSYQPSPTVVGPSPYEVPTHSPAPTMINQVYQHQQNLNLSVDPSLLVETANARHSEVVQRLHSENREQMNAMELNAISHVAQLRLEQAKLQNYARTLEDEAAQNLQAGRQAVAQHQVEAAAAAEQAEQLRVRLLSAEATASNVVAQVEAEAARRAQANQADAEARNDEVARLRSEMQEMMRAQTQGMELLQKSNAELRHRLAEAEAHPASRQEGVQSPPGLDTHRIHTPPEHENAEEEQTKKDDKKEKKSKKSKKHKKDDSSDSSSSIDNKLLFKMIKKMMKSKKEDKEDDEEKGSSSSKPKVKEAEKVVFPKFPQPEQYRNWRIRVREAVVAASDSPDKAHLWINKVWEKDMTEAELRDPEGFSTLDAKIMSALTNILEGDFARQTDTYKETEAHSGRMVRGRQLMFRLHNYFATNALHGSVYDMEDLMNCVMVNENLTTFIRNWDTILSGIPTPPDNSVLEPLFHRQIKKCKVIDHDIQVYERALEGSEQRCYEFLYKAVVNHLKRQRLQKNRDRIARQTGVPTAPAPPAKKIPKGFCVDWVKNGSCSRDKCTYKHQTPRGRSQTPGRTPTTPRRTPSPGGKGKGKTQECKFFKQGVCNRGDKCNFLHKGQPAAPAPGDSSARASSSGKKDKKHKKKERKGGKGRKSSRSSSRSSSKSSSRKSSRSSQGSKGSRGSGRKGGAPSAPAAVCLIGAMLAGSASQADAFTFRKEMSSVPNICTPHYHVALAAVSFNDDAECFTYQIPKDHDLFPIENRKRPRSYDQVYPAGSHWKAAPDSVKEAQTSAKMLQAVVRDEVDGLKPHCKFKCDTEFGCNHCIPKGLNLTCAAPANYKSPCLCIEWIADTGSAQDLIAQRELGQTKTYESSSPIQMMTANGPNAASVQCDVSVDSIGIEVKPYVLPDTPSVLSIGQRCMEEGFDFVWKANSRPYLKTPKGKKIFMDVKDNVPYLKSWHENITVPARRVEPSPNKPRKEVSSSEAGKPSSSPDSEATAKKLRESGDFSHASCYSLLKQVKFKASKNKRSVITSGPKPPDGNAEYVVLGAFSHGGMHGITNRSGQNKELMKFLNAYLKHHGATGPNTSLCINHGSSIKVHKDAHNHREYNNNTISLGEFTNGELWIRDDKAERGSKNYASIRMPDGSTLKGKLHRTKHKMLTFDPKTHHCVRPWKGDRWSITSYVNRAIHQLDPSQISRLREYGFNVPTKVSAPSLVEPEDEVRSMYDLVADAPPAEKGIELRSKPKVKTRSKTEKEKKSEPPQEPEPSEDEEDEMEYIRRLVEECGTDFEGEPEADPGPARAPGGDAVAPDGDAKDKDEKRKKGVEVLKAEAKSLHHMMSHQPKNPFCDVCQRAKMYKPPSYASGGIRTIEAKDFGDHITADHIMIYRDKDTVIEDSRLALVIKDVATGFCYAYPSALKSADECTSALQHFTSSKDVIKNFYSDRAPELSAAAKILKWRHEKSKAYLHQTNAIAERQVRSVTEGTRTNLLQAGISHVYWPYALEHTCTSFNISHVNDAKYTPWYKRFGIKFPGELIPFGCKVDYWVGPKATRKNRERFAPTSEPGVFLGYRFQPGMKWRKEISVLPLKELNRNDFHECLTPISAYQFKIPGGDYVFPMKERFERIQAGFSSEALEGPAAQSLENQDAEAQEDASAPPPVADLTVKPVEVIDPKTGKVVPLPEGERYYDSGGVIGRRYGGTRGSKKPDSIPSSMWVNLSKRQKEKAIDDEARRLALEELDEPIGGSASSSARPSVAAPSEKDCWKVNGNKITRFHFAPRREMFSPDLTDCPIALSRIGKTRDTIIFPVGSVEMINHNDEWRNVRRRNKKTPFKWIGKTEFIILPDSPTSDEANGSSPEFPAMPVTLDGSLEHREKNASHYPVSVEEITELMAMVARPVGRKELIGNPKAQASLDVEWDKLMKKKAWDMASVREWEEISKEAKKKGKKVHVGKVFEICVEKGSELPANDPLRKFKGRTVFQGNNVRDENSDSALFSELGSSPATMEAGKALDAYGHAPGNECQQADGKQAYTQTTLKGTETWVRLPRDRWPKGWAGRYKDPVVRLHLALYGHPDSGGFWEQHCERMLKQVGFRLVFSAAWPSVFFHPKLKLLLAVYVDDFKMAGPKGNMARGWELIGSKIDMDTPTPVGRYLGCDHIARTSTLRKGDHPFAHVFDKNVPDPAAKPASVAAKEDYTEVYPEEGVIARHHVQPRKALYQPHEAEASAYELGRHRYTHFTDVGKPDVVHELWDDNTNRSKRGELWTGVTYICSGSHDRASAMAAVKRIRDKNGAKKEAKRQAFYDINQLSDNKGCMFRPVREVIYDMSSFLQQAIDKYKQLAGPEFHKLKKVSTPFYDDKIARPVETEAEHKGKLAPIASRVLMKLLFAARMARYDLLRAVQGLASRVTKWSSDCDKALHRLMCYVESTKDYTMRCFVGDSPSECKLWLFADSDHAGEHDNKSTSGGILVLVGPNTYYPLAAFSKKQTSTALSSTEAEVVCANVALRALGLPSSALWSVLLNAGGDTATKSPTPLTREYKPFNVKLSPPELGKITVTGLQELDDGRVLEVFNRIKVLPPPDNLSSHPIRDVWLLEKGKWFLHQSTVAWEEREMLDEILDKEYEAAVCVYRRSARDYRRHAEAEAYLHRETDSIRNTGGDYDNAPRRSDADIGLIVSVPHSVQPIVLEDNQATIRILESGKSPAFRHADKTQRLNLGWISEQFKRKHYELAYINTSLQAADILTKPFTNAEKWNRALQLMCVRPHKPPTRNAAAAASGALARLKPRPEAAYKRIVFLLDCSQGSHSICDVDIGYSSDTKVVKVMRTNELDPPETRKAIIQLARDYHRAGASVLLWFHQRNPGGTSKDEKRVEIDKFSKTWASFIDIADALMKMKARFVITWPRDYACWGWHRVRRGLDHYGFGKVPLKPLVEAKDLKPEAVAHYTLASNAKSLVEFIKRGYESRAKKSESRCNFKGTLKEILNHVFNENPKDNISHVVAVALKIQASPASYPSHPSLANMTSAQSKQGVAAREGVLGEEGVLYATAERGERIEAYRAALRSADRLADAMAGLDHLARFSDLTDVFDEPEADADGDATFLGVMTVQEWRDMREFAPNAPWTALYEAWYRHYACRQGNLPMTSQRNTSLTGWSHVILQHIKDLGVLGWGERFEAAVNNTAMYDICHRVHILSEGTGTSLMFPVSSALLDGLYSPALGRISPPPTAEAGGYSSSNFLVAGDSSLALCWMQGKRCHKKTTILPMLSEVVKSNPEIGTVTFEMEWGKGLDRIIDVIETNLASAPLEGVELIVSWAGNDVYGNYGYLGYTWHLTSQWVKRPQTELDQIEHWPAKQRLMVEKSVDRLLELRKHTRVRGLTVLVGGDNARFYNLPEEYDLEMDKYAKRFVSEGVTVIDPASLLMRTTRPDGFHMEVTDDNVTTSLQWWNSLLRSITTDRLITRRKAEFVANQRSVVFRNHFQLGKAEKTLTVPPASQRILEPLKDAPELPAEARDEEEQIVLDHPILMMMPEPVDEHELRPEGSEEVTQVEQVLFSRDVGSDLPLDLVAVDPEAQEDFAFTIAQDIINTTNVLVTDEDAIEKEQEEGIATVWAESEPQDDGESSAPAPEGDRSLPHGSVGYSMALRNVGSSAKAKPEPSKYRQTSDDSMVNDVDADESMGGEPSADRPSEDAPEPYFEWWSAEDVPDFPESHRYMSHSARKALSKMMSYFLRGYSNSKRAQSQRRPPPVITFDPITQEVEWEHFKERLSMQWRNLKPDQIFEAVKFSHSDKSDNGRFELKVLRLPQSAEVHGIRAFQGHSRDLVSEETDLVEMHKDYYVLCDGYTPTMYARPPVGVTGFTHETWDRMYPIGYHATYWNNFSNIVATGLVPGGVTLGGSSGRAFTMMARLPQWERPNNAGLRPGAEVEFAIDLQLACLEGCRILMTKNDVLQTPDWLSNRYLMYAYDRRTGKPVWFNRSYELTRARVSKAREAYLKTGELNNVFNAELIDRAAEADANCILDYTERLYPIENANLGWAEFVGTFMDITRPSHLREEEIFNIDGRTVRFEPGSPLEGAAAEWTLDAQVWFTPEGLAVERHRRTERHHYAVCFNVGFPKLRCPDDRCRFMMLDGYLHCPRCHRKLYNPSDISHLAELADLRAEAVQSGNTQGLHYLAPKASINAKPHEHMRQGQESKKSIAATLKEKCKKVVNKANDSRYGSLQQSLTYEPFTAFNFMSKGMTISSLDEVEMFARIRIPAPGRGTEAKRDFAGSHTSDARAAYIFPPFDDVSNSLFNHGRVLKIELAKHCYFCFQDRFYLVPEIAVLIRATQVASELRHIEPFTILRHDGIEYQPVTGTVPEIMAELVRMLREQADNALTNQERYKMRVRVEVGIYDQPLEVPASLGSMGRTQMLELLGGTRFAVDRRKGWVNRDVEERLVQEGATPAGQMRVPPPPPTPSGRTGPVPPQPSSAPAVRPPPAPPSRGRSPGGAASSSTDVPKRSATPPVKAAPTVKAKTKAMPAAAKSTSPPPPPRPTAAKSAQPPVPSTASTAAPKADASRRPEEYISASDWDDYFAGRGEVRGFAVGDAPAPSAAPAESREPSVAASAAGGRARTRSPRRHDYGGGRTFQEAANDRIRHLRQCDEAIEQQLQNLEQQFTGFPAERLRNWRDQDGRGFDPTRPMPVDATRTDAWFWAALRARYEQRLAPSEVPFVIPDFTDREVLVAHPVEQVTWFIRGWEEYRQASDGSWYRAY